MGKQNVDFADHWKTSVEAYACVVYVYNVTSALY